MCTERKATGEYVLACFMFATMGRNAHFYKKVHLTLSVFQNRTKSFFEILWYGNLNFGYPWG